MEKRFNEMIEIVSSYRSYYQGTKYTATYRHCDDLEQRFIVCLDRSSVKKILSPEAYLGPFFSSLN